MFFLNFFRIFLFLNVYAWVLSGLLRFCDKCENDWVMIYDFVEFALTNKHNTFNFFSDFFDTLFFLNSFSFRWLCMRDLSENDKKKKHFKIVTRAINDSKDVRLLINEKMKQNPKKNHKISGKYSFCSLFCNEKCVHFRIAFFPSTFRFFKLLFGYFFICHLEPLANLLNTCSLLFSTSAPFFQSIMISSVHSLPPPPSKFIY